MCSSDLALPGGAGVAPNMPVELPRDFASIGFVLQQPIFIGASHNSGIGSIAQLIEMAKKAPNEITYAATGRGRLTHLTMELLQARTGIASRFDVSGNFLAIFEADHSSSPLFLLKIASAFFDSTSSAATAIGRLKNTAACPPAPPNSSSMAM